MWLRFSEKWALLLLAAALALLAKPVWMWAFPFRPILSGDFHPVAHKGSGRATIYTDHKGRLILEITGVKTASRSGLTVHLLDAPDAVNNEDAAKAHATVVSRFDPSHDRLRIRLPEGLDLSTPKSVTIWSPRYGVNFTTAPLRPVAD